MVINIWSIHQTSLKNKHTQNQNYIRYEYRREKIIKNFFHGRYFLLAKKMPNKTRAAP